MLSIQDVGTEILENRPRHFYVMLGKEYGIKLKYIQMIAEHYSSDTVDSPSVSDLLRFMSTRHLIPPEPKVYVVRYDEEFLSSLDEKSSVSIQSTKIIGTIVCIYESDRSVQKFDKYLPNYTVSIDNVSDRFMKLYLHKDFPNLPDKLIDTAVRISSDYNNAQNICRCMSCVNVDILYKLDDKQLNSLFGYQISSGDNSVKLAIASRNFSYANSIYDNYTGTDDEFIYTVLSTMVELEKVLTNKFVESDIRKYSKLWTLEDIYNMFMNSYEELKKLRSYSQASSESIIYLMSLLQFKKIPQVEVLRL